MSPELAFFMMMNNYFHDVATAMLMSSGVIMWVVVERLEGHNSPEARSFMLLIYEGITKIAVGSLVWISAGAVPRILTFSSFELAEASGKNHLPGLMAKHLLAFGMVMGGVCLWIILARRIKRLREKR